MGANSEISWTDHTFNPWVGCSKVSPGCAHCYAETLVTGRMARPGTWGEDGAVQRWHVDAHLHASIPGQEQELTPRSGFEEAPL